LNSLFAFAASSDIVVQAARKAAFSSDGVDYSVSNNLLPTQEKINLHTHFMFYHYYTVEKLFNRSKN